MIVKKYLITFAYGVINPVERRIEIETLNDLTEDFIKAEIINKYPKCENQIQKIFSTLLIGEKEIKENNSEILEKREEINNVNLDNNNTSFNW